ncbi:MAG: lytic murein transglycosylase [Candidatus Brennerbacteria bacterium]|nr:lytic murein transglycosylase [Candidatus Brennerbacteria bacterium]
MKNYLYFAVLTIFLLTNFCFSEADDRIINIKINTKQEKQEKNNLIKILSKTFLKSHLEKIFYDPRLTLDKTIIGIFPPEQQKEPIDYFDERFGLLSIDSLENGIAYYQQHLEIFNKMQAEYGINPEIVLGIFRIETYFGKLLGKRQVINSLYSTYVLIPQRRNRTIKELISFLKIYKLGEDDVFVINGSIAGAFGISQFMPSSFHAFAVDGNNDGQINLFNDADAIISVANYLQINGWDDKYKNQRKAVYAYNHSNSYVNAVLVYTQAIKTFIKKYPLSN